MDHLVSCKDEHYLKEEEFAAMHEGLVSFIRMLNAYINSIGTVGTESSTS